MRFVWTHITMVINPVTVILLQLRITMPTYRPYSKYIGLSALSIFITRDITNDCTHHRIRVYPMFNTWVSLSLLHTGYKDRHCRTLTVSQHP